MILNIGEIFPCAGTAKETHFQNKFYWEIEARLDI
jgi:hypothetical protein